MHVFQSINLSVNQLVSQSVSHLVDDVVLSAVGRHARPLTRRSRRSWCTPCGRRLATTCLTVMLVLYAKIYRVARRQAAEIHELERSLRAARRAPTGRLQRRSRRVVSDTKAVKTLGTLMGLFCASWLPFFVLYVVQPFCAAACRVPAEVEAAVTWLGYCNSFINPCVYAFLNRDFRAAFRRVLCCGGDDDTAAARTMTVDGGRTTATSTARTKSSISIRLAYIWRP